MMGAYVDDTEDESILGAHGEITAASIAFDRGFESGFYEKFVHLLNASDLVRGSVDGEHEHEDDGKEYRSVGAVELR
jgi:hypothetical protein